MDKERKGLSGEHHGDLNRPGYVYPGGDEARNERIDELRQLYNDDNVALQQIDVYDGRTEYHAKLHEYRDALMSGNVGEQARLDEWFNKNYPDIK